MNSASLQSFVEQFVSSTRRYLFVRPEDGVLILRPHQGKVHHLKVGGSYRLKI